MSIAIVIPARLRSTRLPNKLLLSETGQPLICHTVERAVRIRDLAPELFSEVVVAADDGAITAAVTEWEARNGGGVRAVMTRADHQSGSDRIAEAIGGMGRDVDAVLNLQGDEPEIDPGSVMGLARFFARARPDIATMVYPVPDEADRRNPSLVKAVLGADGRALYFSRGCIPYRRDGSETAPSYGHVGIYLYARRALERFVGLEPGALERTEGLEQLRALENGMHIAAMVLDTRPPKGIDTAEDYADFVRTCTL